MNPEALTAAHRTLPFGTKVVVFNEPNGKTVTVLAPVVRNALDGVRELATARWGMPGPPPVRRGAITNIRNVKKFTLAGLASNREPVCRGLDVVL